MDDNNYDDCGVDNNDENNKYFPSESMASLLGYMPTSLHNTTLYEIVADNDKVIFIIDHNNDLPPGLPHHNNDHKHEQQTCIHYNPHNFQIPLYNTLNMSGSVDTNGDQQVLNCQSITNTNTNTLKTGLKLPSFFQSIFSPHYPSNKSFCPSKWAFTFQTLLFIRFSPYFSIYRFN